MGFPVPQGTGSRFCQDVHRCIVVSIQHQPTTRTDMRPHAQTLLDQRPTGATVLRGVLGSHSNHWNGMYSSIVVHPPDELSPSCVMDALGKVMVLDHVAYLQVFIGNQIVR